MVAVTVSSGLDPEIWGTLPTLFTGIAFTLGLVLVLIAGSSLLTGNMLLVPISALAGRIPVRDVLRNLGLVLLGNVVGRLFVGLLPGDPDRRHRQHRRRGGHVGGDDVRAARRHRGDQGARGELVAGLPARARRQLAGVPGRLDGDRLGRVSGKILAMFFPVMAFVAMGFDHVVANMFFLPAALFAGHARPRLARHPAQLGARRSSATSSAPSSSSPRPTGTSTSRTSRGRHPRG
jgi:hypothetical protein